MVSVHLWRHARVRRVRHTRLWTTVTRLLVVRSIVRLVLRVSRLGGRHAAVVHTNVVPRAVCTVQHRAGRVRWRSIDPRSWRQRRCRWRRPTVVRVRDTFARLRGRWSLRRLRLLHLRPAVVWRRGRRSATKRLRSVWLPKRSHLILRSRAGLAGNGRRWLSAKRVPLGCGIRIWRLWRWVDVSYPAPAVRSRHRPRRRAVWWLRLLRSRSSPLRTRRPDGSLILICLRMHIGRHRGLWRLAVGAPVA